MIPTNINNNKMKPITLIFLFLLYDIKASQISEHELISLRSRIFTKLDKCTKWRGELKDAQILDYMLYNTKFEEFRIAATEKAVSTYPESVDCLDKMADEIQNLKYVQIHHTNDKNLRHFLDSQQIREIHNILDKTGRIDLIEKALDQHFALLPGKRRFELISEFFQTTKFRTRRQVRNSVVGEAQAREPELLKPEWLIWQTQRQKNIIRNMAKKPKWSSMMTIGDQFYHLRKSNRIKYEPFLTKYCTKNIQQIIGNDSFSQLEIMFRDSDQIEHINTKYQQIIGNLEDEQDRLTADHYGQFCRKIYRLVKFEQTDLFSWMSGKQKIQLAEMIKDSGVEDEQVYHKLYEIFNSTQGEAKEEADEIITLGCRQFIGHILGDQIAEEIEDMRWSANVSSQYIASILMIKNQELENSSEQEEKSADHKKRVIESLSICKRIYLDFNGTCDCNGYSETCDSITHTCQLCKDNRAGYQCEKCAPEYQLVDSKCIPNICQCNKHSNKCVGLVCLECEDNTTGEQCELCADGYYGDATQEVCKKCPCPTSGECLINGENVIECADCPAGFIGTSCDIDSKTFSIDLTSSTISQQTTIPLNDIKDDNTVLS